LSTLQVARSWVEYQPDEVIGVSGKAAANRLENKDV
jgi:hypothetical protein